MPGRTAVGALIAQLRRAHRLTLADVSGRAGLAPSYLSRIENGERCPGAETIDRIAMVFGVRPEVLTGQLPAVRALRQAHGMDLDQFARCLEIDKATLNLVEIGMALPSPTQLAQIAQRLDTTVEMLNVIPEGAA